VSQEEWLESECLQNELIFKKYQILTTWSTIESRLEVQLKKLGELRRAQRWLQVAVAIMAFLLFQIAFIKSYRFTQGSGSVSIRNVLGMQLWQLISGHSAILGVLICCLVLVLILFWGFRNARSS